MYTSLVLLFDNLFTVSGHVRAKSVFRRKKSEL